jgi:hypothetical protein
MAGSRRRFGGARSFVALPPEDNQATLLTGLGNAFAQGVIGCASDGDAEEPAIDAISLNSRRKPACVSGSECAEDPFNEA